MVNNLKRLLIIGGGFGGFSLARRLEKSNLFKVILIDPSNYFVYMPLIHEICVGKIPNNAVKIFFKNALKRTIHIKSIVKEIRFNENKAILKNDKALFYDYLVIASGSIPNIPIEGSEGLPTLKTLKDANIIKRNILDALNEKNITISVVGEGATGIELVGEIASLSKNLKNRFKVHHFVYFNGYFLNIPKFNYAIQNRMRKLGVNVHLEEPVLKIVDKEIITKRRKLKSDRIFVCTGVKPNIIKSDIQIEKGFPVDDFCQIVGVDNAYAIGDVATFSTHGNTSIDLAQVAQKQAKFIVKDLIKKEKGVRRRPYKLKIMGIMISMGTYSAISRLLDNYTIKGFLVWVMKRGYYFYNIIKMRRAPKLLKYFLISLFVHDTFLGEI